MILPTPAPATGSLAHPNGAQKEYAVTATPNDPTFIGRDLPLNWMMSRAEKYAFLSLLESAKPKISVEVGTADGGSLQAIAAASEKVYSIDMDLACRDKLSPRFPNVEFLTGGSAKLLPRVLRAAAERQEPLGFVLIDGDHSEEGVRRDIEAVLSYAPTRPLYVVCHDSFNPHCRQGMLHVQWEACEYVHYVELDFVPGVFFCGQPGVEDRSMWGGLAVAVLRPEKRAVPLEVFECQRALFQAALSRSRYGRYAKACDWAGKTTRLIKRKLFG
jgi:Cephalosporin hydroxylase